MRSFSTAGVTALLKSRVAIVQVLAPSRHRRRRRRRYCFRRAIHCRLLTLAIFSPAFHYPQFSAPVVVTQVPRLCVHHRQPDLDERVAVATLQRGVTARRRHRHGAPVTK